MDYFRCGKILTTHGIKGDLKVLSLSDFDRFQKGKRLYIKHQGKMEEVIVNKVSPFGKYLLVNFEKLLDINLVLKYHSDDIYVAGCDREELEEDEFYYDELIGKELINQNGKSRGIVKEIRELPQCDYLYVLYNGKYYFIPFNEEFITDVTDKIYIEEIEGLFNEN